MRAHRPFDLSALLQRSTLALLLGLGAVAALAPAPAAAQDAQEDEARPGRDRSLLGRQRERFDSRSRERSTKSYPMLERGRARRGEAEVEENLSIQRRRGSEQRKQAADIRQGLRDLGVRDPSDYVDEVPPITSGLPIPSTATPGARQDAAEARYTSRPAGRLGGLQPDPIYSPDPLAPQVLQRVRPGSNGTPMRDAATPLTPPQSPVQQLPDEQQVLDGAQTVLTPSVPAGDPRLSGGNRLTIGNPNAGAAAGGYVQEDAGDYGAVPQGQAAQQTYGDRLLIGEEARRSFEAPVEQPRDYIDPGQPIQR